MSEPRQLVMIKYGHTYLFRYAPGEENAMVEALIGKAADAGCAVDWFDVMILSHQMGPVWAARMADAVKRETA